MKWFPQCGLWVLVLLVLLPKSSGFHHIEPKTRQTYSGSYRLQQSPGDGEEPEFEPLDVMLDRARKRGVNPMIRIQALAGAPLLKGSGIPLTRGDALFTATALLIGAKGFAVGLLVGKATSSRLPFRQDLPPLLVQLYPVLLAIACDLTIS